MSDAETWAWPSSSPPFISPVSRGSGAATVKVPGPQVTTTPSAPNDHPAAPALVPATFASRANPCRNVPASTSKPAMESSSPHPIRGIRQNMSAD